MTHRAPPELGASQHRRLVDRALLHPLATTALLGTLTLYYLLAGGLLGCLRGCRGLTVMVAERCGRRHVREPSQTRREQP